MGSNAYMLDGVMFAGLSARLAARMTGSGTARWRARQCAANIQRAGHFGAGGSTAG